MDREIEFLCKRITDDSKRVEELQFKEANDKLAGLLRTAYQSYLDAGFSEEQSFWMVAKIVERAFENS